MFPNINYLDFNGHTLTYGNYGGLNYSAGMLGGTITGTVADPAPVDAYDQLFYYHDIVYQNSSDLIVRREADIHLIEGVSQLLHDAAENAASGWFTV